MNPLRSVGARLSLALLLVVAGALGIVYLFVVPSLEGRLVDAKVSQLRRAAPSLGQRLPVARFGWRDFLESAAATTNARVVIYDVFRPPLTLIVVGDSREGASSTDVEDDPVAQQAAMTLSGARGTISRGGERYAEVAVPTRTGPILLLTASLRDTLASVQLVKRRLLLAGGLALVVALLIGYGGAWIFARRLRRLERAAERIAGGRFDVPVLDRGADEVGELARAFDRMRLRLAQLDHARREFIANASHELRTPLFALGGFLELMRDEDVDEATREEFLATMRDQVARLAKLATDLLDLSRLDAGQLEVEHEAVSLADLARTVADEFAAVARTREHRVEIEVDEAAVALADEQRTLQIGRILLENALLHTPPGTGVTIRVRRVEGSVTLAVEDEGPGIPERDAPHVFERFYRLEEGSQASGSGLGLAIASELAALMGGSVELDSRPGRTVFALRLPAARFHVKTPPIEATQRVRLQSPRGR